MATIDQAAAVAEVWESSLKDEETWCVVDAKWWRSWTKFAGFDENRGVATGQGEGMQPGPINNSTLALENSEGVLLKRNIYEHIDYNLVHKNVWNLLHEWYGGGPVFDRTVQIVGYSTTKVDFYPEIVRIHSVDTEGAVSEDYRQERFESSSSLYGIFKMLSIRDEQKAAPDEQKEGASHDENKMADSDDEKVYHLDDFRIWMREALAVPNDPPPAYDAVQSLEGSDDKNDSLGAQAQGDSQVEGQVSTPSPEGDEEKASNGENKSKKPQDGWVLIPKKEYAKKLGDVAGFKPLFEIAIEKQKSDGHFSRYVKPWNDFEVGDTIDAKDSFRKWYESEVKEVDGKRIFVHFKTFADTWDEWYDTTIEEDVKRLAAQGTHTNGPRQQKNASSTAITTSSYGTSSYGTSSYGSSYGTSSYSSYSSYSYGNDKGTPSVNGLVGLRNLGNTCFMNSTIQCLSNSPLLTKYFVSDEYKRDLNEDNPLGWKGKVATAYGELMQEMWSNKNTTCAPREFKSVLGEFAPRFAGFQQQDSQEFLSFLLDGIHEDLNRVLKKPSTSTVEGAGRPDSEVAKEAWETHQMRNQSIVVDWVQGQFKSEVACPECDRHSVTFDPFMFVSLPVPMSETKLQTVTVVFAEPEKQSVEYCVRVPKLGRLNELKTLLEPLTGISAKAQVIADVHNHGVFKFYNEEDSVSTMLRTDVIYMFEVPELLEGKPTDFVCHQVYHTTKDQSSSTSSYNYSYATKIGIPCVLALRRNSKISNSELMKLLLAKTMQAASVDAMDALAEKLDNNLIIESSTSKDADAVSPAGDSLDEPSKEAESAEESAGQPNTNGLPFSVKVEEAARYSSVSSELSDMPEIEVGNDRTPTYAFQLEWHKELPDKLTQGNSTKHESAEAAMTSTSGPAESVPLQTCFEAFSQEETLGEEEMWYCSDCKEFRQATKKMDIWSPPRILIIHLKRFSYTQYSRDKISTVVDFPMEGLNLGEHCLDPRSKDCLYDLYAVSNHMGSMGGGHYTAYAKNLVDGEWYEYDDSRTSVANKAHIISSSAYVLFYVRRDSNDEDKKYLGSVGTEGGEGAPAKVQDASSDNDNAIEPGNASEA